MTVDELKKALEIYNKVSEAEIRIKQIQDMFHHGWHATITCNDRIVGSIDVPIEIAEVFLNDTLKKYFEQKAQYEKELASL